MSIKNTAAERAALTIQLAFDAARREDSGGEAVANLKPLTAHVQAAIDEETKPLHGKIADLKSKLEGYQEVGLIKAGAGWCVQCSVCCGTGMPISDKPCICGGTGFASDEMAGLREETLRLEPLVDALREARNLLIAEDYHRDSRIVHQIDAALALVEGKAQVNSPPVENVPR